MQAIPRRPVGRQVIWPNRQENRPCHSFASTSAMERTSPTGEDIGRLIEVKKKNCSFGDGAAQYAS
jgi:hypothetical protein